jgi:hypothetical protein
VRPDLLLTYGGQWLARDTIAAACRRCIPVVFWLRNCCYTDAGLFGPVDAVVVPSRFCQEFYRRTFGLECTALPPLIDGSRVICPEVRGLYVTFVNPQPDKGIFLFAGIVSALARG